MSVLLKDLVFDAVKLPANWWEQIDFIAAEKLNIAPGALQNTEIISCAVDSRRGSPKLLVTLKSDCQIPGVGTELSEKELLEYSALPPEIPEKSSLKNPIVVGTGPAGIFAGLILALAGCKPLIIDRGSDISRRNAAVEKFITDSVLDENNNLLIGEGGAGTYSDGKLYTGTKDPSARWVKKIMTECGAPAEILWRSRGHIGSDYLGKMAENLRKMIIDAGGTFLFDTEITDIIEHNGVCSGVISASGEKFTAPAVLIAPGLGGRKLVAKLTEHAAYMLKPFQIGCRVEHPQKLIDRSMYHMMNRPASLGAAEYHIVARKHPKHVASFCMCPGGEVVNATAWENQSISNGMSCFQRDGEFANSCLISTFAPGELGNSLADLHRLIQDMEKKCFAASGSYSLPAQDVAAFLRREKCLKNFRSSCRVGITPGRIDEIIMPQLYNALASAVKEFDCRMKGFIKEGKFIGVESCVSSPVRFERIPEKLHSTLSGLYLSGEGCGAAGGIISAACDGIKCALAMLK